MKCFHHNDADGRCAAAIVAWFHGAWNHSQPFDPDALKFIEMDYKTTPEIAMVGPQERVYIVDFSFKPEVMTELRKRTDDVVWIDHHASCQDYAYARENIAGLRDFEDKGLSGCELTWMYLFGTRAQSPKMPYGIQLIGDYDAWRLRLPNVMEFRAGIEIEDQSPLSAMWPRLFESRKAVEDIIQAGMICIHYRDQYCADMMKQFGFETELDGIQAYVCNVFRFGSPGFGATFKAYPMCIAFAFDGSRFTVSLYSERKDIDCAAIAKKFGGGGHHGAAGFVCDQLPFKLFLEGKTR